MNLLFVLCAALVAFVASWPQVQAYECNKPWQKVNDDICLLLNSGIKSWNHANFLCKFYESDLLYIQNEAESKALTNYLNNLIRYRFNQKSYVWLDAKKNTSNNKWTWTRTNNTVDYSNWSSYARPDEAKSTLNCACFKLKDGSWKDCDCESTNHFVCRKSDKPTNQTTAGTTTIALETTTSETLTTTEPPKPVQIPVTIETVKANAEVKLGNESTTTTTVKAIVEEPPRIALPEVIDPTPAPVTEPVAMISVPPSKPVQAHLPPEVPAPVVISPVVHTTPATTTQGITTTLASEVAQTVQTIAPVKEVVSNVVMPAAQAPVTLKDLTAKTGTKPQVESLDIHVPEILPIKIIEEILKPQDKPTGRMIGKNIDADTIQSSVSSLEVNPETLLNSNSLPTIDQVREDIRNKVESESNGVQSNLPYPPVMQPDEQTTKPNVELYLPLTEIDPQQYFKLTPKIPEIPGEKNTDLTIVEADQVPSETLDYGFSSTESPAIVGEVQSDEQAIPVPTNSLADIPQVSDNIQVLDSDEIFQSRPRVIDQQSVTLPKMVLSANEPSVRKDARMDGGALKLLRLLRPRNRFYRLKPEMLVEETPNMIRTLSGKIKTNETANTPGVELKNIRKIDSTEEANRNVKVNVRTNDLTSEDKNIIISSKIMIDEEERKDRNLDVKSPDVIQKENEKLISLLSEQNNLDPGKVIIRTSISKSTETFRLFECPNGYGYYSISNTNCNKYKRCDDWDLRNAVLTINKCAEGQVFSFTKLSCVAHTEYECEDKVDKFVTFEENF